MPQVIWWGFCAAGGVGDTPALNEASTVRLFPDGHVADRDTATGRALAAFVVAGVIVMAGSILARSIGLRGAKRLAAAIALIAIALPIGGRVGLRNKFPLYRPQLSAMSDLRLPSNYKVIFFRVTSDDCYVLRKDWVKSGPPQPDACEAVAVAVAQWGQNPPVVGAGSQCGWKSQRGEQTLVALAAPGATKSSLR